MDRDNRKNKAMEGLKSLVRLFKGLFKDGAPQDQPEGSYSFGLNGVLNSSEGEEDIISNENSNAIAGALPENFIPVGSVYMTGKRIAVLSSHINNEISEIGIYNANSRKYETIVNDELSPLKDRLKFTYHKQLSLSYRLRRGCEDTIYWANNGKPKYFNFSSPGSFKRNGFWKASKFNLQKSYEKMPIFDKVEVLNSGGAMEPGSYNISVQYIDESLNPTEWATTSHMIKIYNDQPSMEYGKIRGSINSDVDYHDFPSTGKAIKIKLSNLDQDYLYYRIAIIASNSGTGNINDVLYTTPIPTTKDTFIYTGDNHVERGSEEEILQMAEIIGDAKFVQQVDNTLIVGNTQGLQIDYCKLQKYASRVKADCVLKEVTLTNIKDPANAKNPTHEFDGGVEYMPGEIYSFGLAYVLEGNIICPVGHIPGKRDVDASVVFSPGERTYPMSSDNKGSSTYSERSSCGTESFWGLDYGGEPLVGKNHRHHRFPTRKELGKPLITTTIGDPQPTNFYSLKVSMSINLRLPVPCAEDDPDCAAGTTKTFNILIEYTVGGENKSFVFTVDPNLYANGYDSSISVVIEEYSNYSGYNNFVVTGYSITDQYGEFVTVDQYYDTLGDPENYSNNNKPTFTAVSSTHTSTTEEKVVKSEILGIKFSGIEKPTLEETGGLEVIGYLIVRQERTEFEKTVLDTGVLIPSVVNNKYVSHGLLQPETTNVSPSVFGLIHLEHKFNGREYAEYDYLVQEGNYRVTKRKYGKINYDDVFDGSSYNGKHHKSGNDDGKDPDGSPTTGGWDGWSLNIISRDNIVTFDNVYSGFNFSRENDIEDHFYLDALDTKSINEGANHVYNIAADNKVGFVQLKSSASISSTHKLPYVSLRKTNADPYSNFRVLPYYKETLNPVYFGSEEVSEVSVFNGDTYISPVRYNNTVYWDNRIANRGGRTSVFKIVLGALVIAIGTLVAIFSAGILAVPATIAIGAGVAIIGGGVLFLSSGFKIAAYNKAYAQEYDKGLRETALDDWVDAFYKYKNTTNQWTSPSDGTFGFDGNGQRGQSGPSDDTIQWISECITDLWFETSINTNLRNGFPDDASPTFLPSPWKTESGNDTKIRTWEFFKKYYQNSNAQRYPISTLENHAARKLLIFDEKRNDNRVYLGAPLGEYYHVNPDYKRKNHQKIFYHLPLEYDCCSECREQFPLRFHYSLQSYQEDLSDNYRIFLPNNYKDIEGETGEITNLYRMGSSLYVHTEEALWQVPKNMQERITDQIVSFIGTGEAYSIPPKMMAEDDTGNSAGLRHSAGALKTPQGIYFPSEAEGKMYLFDGQKLAAISDQGLYTWFKNNLPVQLDAGYRRVKERDYPYQNNPSNPHGTGFISVYDSRNQRVIFSKKDFSYVDDLENNDFEICSENGHLIVFPEYSTIISSKEALGWRYIGIVDCKMKFERQVIKTRSTTWQEHKVNYIEMEYSVVEGEVQEDPPIYNKSWTISYSEKRQTWASWHSYLPNFFFNVPEEFFSWRLKDPNFWVHNVPGMYQTFYGERKPFIVEFVNNGNPMINKVWDYIRWITEAKKLDADSGEFFEERYVTFNKAILYNSRQTTGLLNFKVKDTQSNSEDYLMQQVYNGSLDEPTIDRNEGDWTMNQLRDIRVDYSKPMFKSNKEFVQDDYFIDKVLDSTVLDLDKDWSELESLRDKYLVVRLIFDNFDDVKLLFNYAAGDEYQSFR